MHDLRFIRENPDAFDAGLARRGLAPASAEILELDVQRRAAQTSMQEMQQRRNEASKLIGAAKKSGEDAADLIAEVQSIKDRMDAAEQDERAKAAALKQILETLPNLPADDVPDGADEDDNREERVVGEARQMTFEAREHFDLGEALGMMDFETAAKLSGSRFVVLSGALAKLDRALATFMLTLHTEEFGYTEVVPPALVRSQTMYGTGQLPKFEEDLYRAGDDFWLIPTAEVPLTSLVADAVTNVDELPIRVTAWTPCFRSEAGSAGKDTRGMLRQHQFSKVELVSITHPDESENELERMTGCAEEVLKRLGLSYRLVTLCTGDMGFNARKTYDIEVWLPGQNRYREISSCSNCWDFQARRMNARFKVPTEKGTRFVHTLNGSGLAVGRTLIAVLENYQQEDGSIAVPDVLKPFMGGQDRIEVDRG